MVERAFQPDLRENGHADPLGKRILIGKLIEEGIEPPVFLEKGIIMAGMLHWLYGDSESGKTFLALWLVKRFIEAGLIVLYLDKENGPEVIGERLELLGCNPDAVDKYLYYYDEPELRLDSRSLGAYEKHMKEIDPALTVFDSTRGFLTSADLEESSNDDLDKLYKLLLKPIRTAKRTAVVLDHTGHSGNHARGAKRKKDLCDVMFQVSSTGFDETTVGEVKLKRRKGRRGYIPETIKFSAGGGEEKFIFRRSDGTIEDSPLAGLKDTEQRALDYIRGGGETGVAYKHLLAHMGGSKGTVSRATNELLNRSLITRRNGRYYAREMEPKSGLDKRRSTGYKRFQFGSRKPPEPEGDADGSSGSIPLGMEPPEPAQPGSETDSQKEPNADSSHRDTPGDHHSLHRPSSEQVREDGVIGDGEVSRLVDEYLAKVPEWWQEQLALCRKNPNLIRRTASDVALAVLGSPYRWREVEPHIECYVGEPVSEGG